MAGKAAKFPSASQVRHGCGGGEEVERWDGPPRGGPPFLRVKAVPKGQVRTKRGEEEEEGAYEIAAKEGQAGSGSRQHATTRQRPSEDSEEALRVMWS